MIRRVAPAVITIKLLCSAALAASPDVGTAVVVKNEVFLESGQAKQDLVKGATVHQNEIVVTGIASGAEMELLDKTKLAVGPKARLVLDKFVYDASASRGSISLNVTRGAFRFITGIAPKETYEIKTPTASLGVRGTVFDGYVGDAGETVVLLYNGALQVCSFTGVCQIQIRPGSIIFVSADGVFSWYSRCNDENIRRIGFDNVFPFVGNTLYVDPVRRLSREDFDCVPPAPRTTPTTTTPGINAPSPTTTQAPTATSPTTTQTSTAPSPTTTQTPIPPAENELGLPLLGFAAIAVVTTVIADQPTSP